MCERQEEGQTMKRGNIERTKSIAGILLVGVGILLLRQELNQTLRHIHNLISNAPSGMLPMVLVDEAQQTWRTSGTDFSRVLQHVFQQIFVSFWPLLLVSIGMGISTEFRR